MSEVKGQVGPPLLYYSKQTFFGAKRKLDPFVYFSPSPCCIPLPRLSLSPLPPSLTPFTSTSPFLSSFSSSSPFLFFLDATTHLYKRSCPSVGPSVGPSVPCYFRTTKNVTSYAPMTTKFDMDQKTVKDNSLMTSKCRSVSLSVHPTKENERKVPTR